MRVLLVEDDVTLSSALSEGLGRANTVVEDDDAADDCVETFSMPGFVARFRTAP